ncbi:hypothetical protein BDW59DRAFT_143170 [Aspergillus cavernicola]|uniref:DUF7726 domain-containing protein n=1 Tax=Aspergillus cavernicola TaxID=176166 RepID=A0ABR4IL37_9EURO
MDQFQQAMKEMNHDGSLSPPSVIRALRARLDELNKAKAMVLIGSKPKRKASMPDLDSKSESEPEAEDLDEDDDSRLIEYRWSCGQIRAKIRKLIEDKEMQVGEFQKAIGVGSKPYYDFMKQNGKTKGEFSTVYSGAHRFFAERDILNVKSKKKAPATKKTKLEYEQKYDLSNIYLPGEDEADVEVYDTCDGVRKKIRAHLRDSGATRAAFCREISKTFPASMGKSLSPSSLAQFLSKSGPNKGNTSAAFYAGYVFFEKLRIRDGKPKTEFRLDMEHAWGASGFDRKTPANTSYICRVGRELYIDEFGRVRSG